MKVLIFITLIASLVTSCSKSVQGPQTTSPDQELNQDRYVQPNYFPPITFNIHFVRIQDSVLYATFEVVKKDDGSRPYSIQILFYGRVYGMPTIYSAGSINFKIRVPYGAFLNNQIQQALDGMIFIDATSPLWGNEPFAYQAW